MTVQDFVWIAVGEVLLAFTFGLGLLTGCAMRKKGEPRDGYGN